MKECGTCCEPFNKTTRSRIVCAYCPEFSACASCTERYLLDSTQDAHCMSCRKVWPRSFLAENFTQKFMNKIYKEHRENVLLEREKSLMPETQNFVELEIKIRKLSDRFVATTRRVARARHEILRAKTMYIDDADEFRAGEKRLETVARCRTAFYEEKSKLENLEETIRFLNLYRHGQRDSTRMKRLFVRACPATECKGFLGSDWKCGICEKETCKECHEVLLTEDHTCDPNSVETARLLARDSRPCPQCACMIFKIDGCDQMWCTQCHTAFSWRHGTIVTSIVHNPHYYEYLRAAGTLPRNPLDVPCGGLPDWQFVRPFVNHAVYRLPIHADQVLRHTYAAREFNPALNRELRIKFMMNELTADKFKTLIQRDEKNRQKNSDIYNVLEMFSTVMTDLFQKLVNNGDVQVFTTEFEQVRDYVNESMGTVSKNYSNCRVPRIRPHDNSWDM